MRNKKAYKIIQPITNEDRFSNYYCYYLFWVAVGYYLWKKILIITGFRFHPTDFELLHYYLHNKNLGRDALVQAIAEVEDICRLEPWELPGHSNIHSGDQVWYFFYRPNYKYRNSTRINRRTNEGYWKPTGNPRKIMARDLETEIGQKRTLVFYKGRVSDNNKNKTGWIMHEYELTATHPNQTTFVLCKLKKKYGKGEFSCIEEGQSSHYLPPNLGNYIANNAIPAEVARCLTDRSDPNELLGNLELEVFNEHEGLESPSTESWNSNLVGDCPKNEGSDLPCNLRNHVAENAIPNYQLFVEVPIEQEVHQNQSSTNEQDSNFGKLVSAAETSNQYNLVIENDGSTMPCNSKNATAEDSVQMDLANLSGQSTDELFAEMIQDRSILNELLGKLEREVFNEHEGLEYPSTESWNSYLVGDCPKNEGSDLPCNLGNHVAENAIPNYQLFVEVPIEQEVPQNQSSTNEQDNNFGKLISAAETSNQYNLVIENDGSTMHSNSKNATAEDSIQMDLANLAGQSTDELFAELDALPEVQGNGFRGLFDDWMSDEIFQEIEIPNASYNQSSTNEEQNLTATNGGLSFEGTMESPHAINPSRKGHALIKGDLAGTFSPTQTERNTLFSNIVVFRRN